jgi:hypothetical protein
LPMELTTPPVTKTNLVLWESMLVSMSPRPYLNGQPGNRCTVPRLLSSSSARPSGQPARRLSSQRPHNPIPFGWPEQPAWDAAEGPRSRGARFTTRLAATRALEPTEVFSGLRSALGIMQPCVLSRDTWNARRLDCSSLSRLASTAVTVRAHSRTVNAGKLGPRTGPKDRIKTPAAPALCG